MVVVLEHAVVPDGGVYVAAAVAGEEDTAALSRARVSCCCHTDRIVAHARIQCSRHGADGRGTHQHRLALRALQRVIANINGLIPH